jgi:hypothetical protein
MKTNTVPKWEIKINTVPRQKNENKQLHMGVIHQDEEITKMKIQANSKNMWNHLFK